MSICATKPLGMCLREARRSAGNESIIAAARKTKRSPEAVGRHERGEVNLHPQDVIQYAEAYGSPDLLIRYCGECPIYRTLNANSPMDRDLPWGALKLSTRLNRAASFAMLLEQIADDGKIDNHELPEFKSVVAFLQEINEASRDLFLYAMSAGIIIPESMKKDRSAVTDAVRGSIAR